MGKVKAMLMAKTMDDMGTDEYPDLYPDLTRAVDEPTKAELAVGYGIQNLTISSKALVTNARHLTVGDAIEIGEVITRLQNIVKAVNKPF